MKAKRQDLCFYPTGCAPLIRIKHRRPLRRLGPVLQSDERMNANPFDVLVGLDDDLFLASALTRDWISDINCAAAEKKAQTVIRASPSVMTSIVPQAARPPIIAPEHIMESEIPYPPRRIRTVHDAKKMAALRLGSVYGASVICYEGWYPAGPLQY